MGPGASDSGLIFSPIRPIVLRRRLTSSASWTPVGRVRPSANVVKDGLFELESGEQIQVALLDQEKEWGGDEERGWEEEGGREGASEQEQERADDSRTGEEDETGAVAIEVESEGTIRVTKVVARDSLGDDSDVEENVQQPQRQSLLFVATSSIEGRCDNYVSHSFFNGI